MPTKTSAVSVGSNVRAEMARQALSQTQVAKVLGVSQSGVSRRLLGVIAFDVVELGTLAHLFGVPASYLLGESAAA